MKKKSLVLSLIAVLAIVAAAIWMFRPQPSKIGLVNFPQFMAARMSLSADAANVKISMVDDLSKMKDFDAILCFGMGAKWTDEDRDQFALLDKKRCPIWYSRPPIHKTTFARSIAYRPKSYQNTLAMAGHSTTARASTTYVRKYSRRSSVKVR